MESNAAWIYGLADFSHIYTSKTRKLLNLKKYFKTLHNQFKGIYIAYL